jgi:hypothetical protein
MEEITCKQLDSIAINMIDQNNKMHTINYGNFINPIESSLSTTCNNGVYEISIKLKCCGYQLALDK